MKTLQDVLQKLDEMEVNPDEVRISRAAFKYLLERAEEVITAEEEEDQE